MEVAARTSAETAHAQIIPLIPIARSPYSSLRLDRHVHEMSAIIQKLFRILQVKYEACPTFLRELEQNLPFVHWELSETAPGVISIYLFCKAFKGNTLQQFFSEMIDQWLLAGTHANHVSTKQQTFSFVDFPKKHFF